MSEQGREGILPLYRTDDVRSGDTVRRETVDGGSQEGASSSFRQQPTQTG